ncbi:hypothetical protein DPEC_G00141810 [Dallia pectoralis]|uniref:Uncharacterized protein n=1 Tax=Dallia pectoralis TaxID=75939 RepID=A0ACC2GNB6_DALPE|nr:hypothetical protein DPEC_G00141810 [Dallia pectoralis]
MANRNKKHGRCETGNFYSLLILTMKPRRIQKSTKLHLRDPEADRGHKSGSKTQSNLAQNKPFSGKIFFLDLPSNRRSEALENDIYLLGGTVEKFFSKEIKYLVSNKREARYVQCLGFESPVPSPDSGPSSPHARPGSYRESRKGSSQGQTDTVVTSRGKSLLVRVVKGQERIQVNKILSNALEWGVKVLYIDDVLDYIEKKKKVLCIPEKPTTAVVRKSTEAHPTRKPAFQKCKGRRISKPFVKVEDSSRHYRPIYQAMSCMPEFDLTSAPPCSPFFVEDRFGKRTREPRNLGGRAASEEKRPVRSRRNREKKRGGYCECCALKYDSIKSHLRSKQHKAFSRSDEYLVVDRLISTLPFNFRHIKTPPARRPKCSVSSMVCAPGLSIQIKEELGKGVNDTEATEVGLEPWVALVERQLNPGNVAPERDMVPYKPQPKHSSLSCKTPCQQKSQAAPPTRHPRRAVSKEGPSPCTDRADPEHGHCHQGQRTLLDMVGSSMLHRRHESDGYSTLPREEDSEYVCPVECLNVALSQPHPVVLPEPAKPGALKGCELDRDMPAGDVLPGHKAGATHTAAPVRTLRRRVRDYRRKRRKVVRPQAATTEQEHQSSSLLKLWQLFHSSEDVDWEFRGFPSELSEGCDLECFQSPACL